MAAKWQQWMPLHIDKWRGSPAVRAMHPAARSGYLDLIISQWQSEDCSIPSDPMGLAELSGLGDEMWATYGARILRNFEKMENGRLRNLVCFEEWQEAKRIFEARKASANRTNIVRKPNGNRDGDRQEKGRSPSRPANTITGTVTLTETLETGGAPDGAPPPDEPSLVPKRFVDEAKRIGEKLRSMSAPADSAFPPGLSELQYASGILEHCAIVDTFKIRDALSKAVVLLGKTEKCEPHIAAQRMESRMLAAQARGDTINAFWFEDSRWKGDAAASRSTRSAPRSDVPSWSPEVCAAYDELREKEEREAYEMWKGMNEKFRIANPWRRRVFESDGSPKEGVSA